MFRSKIIVFQNHTCRQFVKENDIHGTEYRMLHALCKHSTMELKKVVGETKCRKSRCSRQNITIPGSILRLKIGCSRIFRTTTMCFSSGGTNPVSSSADSRIHGMNATLPRWIGTESFWHGAKVAAEPYTMIWETPTSPSCLPAKPM